MLTLNIQIGSNPILIHHPKLYIPSNPPITVGEVGQIVGWKYINNKPIPLYQSIPSVSGDAGKLVSIACLMLRLLSQQNVSQKLVTIHDDNRLRIWRIEDGVCVAITPNNIINFKIQSIVTHNHQSRFIILIGQKTIGIIDCWTAKLITHFQPQIDSYSKLVKGIINENKDLQLLDNNGKMYKLNMSQLFAQKLMDVGSYVSNAIKSLQELDKSIIIIKSAKIQNSFKKIVQNDYTQQLNQVLNYIQLQKLKSSVTQVINPDILEQYPFLYQQFQNQQPSVSNTFFVKGTKLWYWLGMKSGKLFGMSSIVGINKQWGMLKDSDCDRPVKYISILQNILIVSWQNGVFCAYNVDSHDYMIEQQLKNKKINNIQDNVNIVDMTKSRIYKQKLSAGIKYPLKIYNTVSKSNINDLLGFQLYNNEVILFDFKNKKMENFRGISFDEKIYCILLIQDYIGIASTSGINMYNIQHFERTILYTQWNWLDYQIFDKIIWGQDYHSFNMKNVTGLNMIQFSNRHYYKKIDYRNSNQLLYETYDFIQQSQLANEEYPHFEFLQKVQTLSTINSISQNNNVTIIKYKHNNVKKDHWSNTSFIIHGYLTKQLDNVDGQLNQILNDDFIFYSLFLWDQINCTHLRSLMSSLPKRLLWKKRYIHQGIGKSFTIYFNNLSRFRLTHQLATYQAIATTSFFQLYSTKNICYTDQMVSIVQYFTSIQQIDPQSKSLNAQTLSKMSICQNLNIIKACLNLLMSTVITQNIKIHPTYDYFILGMKNMQQNKNKLSLLNVTQTHWMVLMGIYFIYGNNRKDQLQYQFSRIIVERIMQSIQLVNFEKKPQLVIVVMKIFNEGIHKWKQFITKEQIIKFTTQLFRIFFYYDGINFISQDDKKFNFCFDKLSTTEIKKMKQNILRTIVYISKEFNNEFLNVLRIQSVNQRYHLAYPSSVIEILRQYIKTQKPFNHLVFFIQLLLQCLSPMTPQLRKYVQKNVLATLQLMCLYKTISFNQPSQKLSLLTQSHIYIYCLRTSTKWRTISIKNNSEQKEQRSLSPDKQIMKKKQKQNNMVLEMSPKGTYVALLSNNKLQIWRLSSGFWSGVLGAFSQGWNFQAEGNSLIWQQDEQSITVMNPNPSKNKNYIL